MRLALTVFLLLISVPRVFAQPDIVATVGEPVGTFPKWEERVLHQLTNRARVAPATDLVGCGANCSAAELAPTCYTAIAPLAWNLDLNEAARFHSAHMARSNYFSHNSSCKLFPDIDARYPETCDASFACSCEAGSPVTTPSGRVGLFGTTYSGEIIAAGQTTPYQVFYAWLHEPAPTDTSCAFTSPNGHRWLILKNAGPAVGYGHHFEASATYDHYWAGDFGGSGTVVPKIPSGSHWGATTRLKQEATIEFWANWYDLSGPTEPSVIVDGVSNPLVLGRGTLTSGAWTATLSGLGSGCHTYYFSFRDSASQIQSYPTTGSFGIGDSSCADWTSTRADSTPPGTPTGLIATATSTSSVSVSWSSSANAAQYQLERSSNNSAYALIATIPGTTYTDTPVSANTTYLYRVRALNASSVPSGYSNVDFATTVIFTDDPLVAQSTVIKSVHLTELRTAVNAMRAAVGLPPAGFTDSGAPGVLVKAVHITELRTALDGARSALGVSTGGYTDASLTAGVTLVKAVHFQELRDRTK